MFNLESEWVYKLHGCGLKEAQWITELISGGLAGQ